MRRALLIGINYFGTTAELRGCHTDIRNVSIMLQQYGYEIKTILDDPEDPDYLKPDSPTREHILTGITELVRGAKSGDSIYIHYSGHGTWLRDLSGDEPDGRDEVICPVDEFITDDELNAIVRTLAPGARLRAVFDCCFSGSVLDLLYRYDGFNQIQLETRNTSIPDSGVRSDSGFGSNSGSELDPNPDLDIIMISGCTDKQTSADALINPSEYSGALTWAYLKALTISKYFKAGDQQTNRYSSWKDLIHVIRELLKKKKFTQVPQLDSTTPDFDVPIDI